MASRDRGAQAPFALPIVGSPCYRRAPHHRCSTLVRVVGGARERGPGYATAAPLFLWAWVLAENGGAYLYARRGAWWGRGLRAFGWVAFLPLSLGFYLLSFWATSTFMFVTLSVLLGILVVGPAYCFASLAWQRE